jgi:predicted MFS family arabinose efflux permease
VIGSIVLAIATDLFPLEMRGRVMGFVQTAFGASQVLGIPAGLFFSNLWGWHAPFLMIVGISVTVGAVILKGLRPIDAHLKLQGARQSPFRHLFTTLSEGRYRLAFFVTMFLSLGGFMLMPFSSAFTVHNLGISVDRLPIIYLITGVFAIFTGPLVGRAADAFGKYNIFVFGGILTMIMVFIYTNLGVTPLPLVIIVNIVLFVGIFSRMVPSQALISAIPEPAKRGSFMSVNSSLQQMAGGLASVIAGFIVSELPDGRIAHFNVLGYILMGTVLTAIFLMYFVHKHVVEKLRPAH